MINKYYRTVEVASFSYHTHRAGPCIAWREGMEARTALLRRPTDRSIKSDKDRERIRESMHRQSQASKDGRAGRPATLAASPRRPKGEKAIREGKTRPGTRLSFQISALALVYLLSAGCSCAPKSRSEAR